MRYRNYYHTMAIIIPLDLYNLDLRSFSTAPLERRAAGKRTLFFLPATDVYMYALDVYQVLITTVWAWGGITISGGWVAFSDDPHAPPDLARHECRVFDRLLACSAQIYPSPKSLRSILVVPPLRMSREGRVYMLHVMWGLGTCKSC